MATKAPVIDAVLVPPSACITSQSRRIVLSPSACMSTTDLMLRPISLCISCVLPPILPFADSLGVLTPVDLGSMEYSAVTQPPSDSALRKKGTLSSTVAVHMTLVSPTSISTDPSACLLYSLVILTGLIWPGFLPSILFIHYPPVSCLLRPLPLIYFTWAIDFKPRSFTLFNRQNMYPLRWLFPHWRHSLPGPGPSVLPGHIPARNG